VCLSEALGKIDYRFKTRFKIHAMRYEGHLVQVDERKMTVGRDFPQASSRKSSRNHSLPAGRHIF
jgi:hypothetical protein